MPLEGKGKDRILMELENPDSKCKTCDFYETCLKDPNFDEDSFDGCMDYVLKKVRTSAVVE